MMEATIELEKRSAHMTVLPAGAALSVCLYDVP